MTIQAYQTLYESSIAYGMRKALQAKQSKAEKLLQLASLEKRCNEKHVEIEDLKRAIIDRLAEEEQEKEEKQRDHMGETKAKRDKNGVARKQLKDKLTDFNIGT